MKLNLQVTTKEEQKVKAYLEANASEVLAEKINGGVKIQKDGKTLINKKTLAGFMKFACDEAKKQAEKGASSACIDDDTVYGWSVHYFEEDSIEGTRYNEDGTEYKAPVPKVTAKAPAVKSDPPKPQPKPQMSMFDLLDAKPEEPAAEEPDDEPTDEDYAEVAEVLVEEEKTKPSKRTASPMYQKYLDVQGKYPQAVVAMRLGDFYEVFGDNAKLLADELPLTLTGRDCGLESRVPMVGFPYHASDAYFDKIARNGHNIGLIENDGSRKLPSAQTVDPETGEIIGEIPEEEMREFDGDIDEAIPTVSGLLKGYSEEPKTDEKLEQDMFALIDDEDDFDVTAFDAEAVAVLSEMFGNEITLR